MATDRRNAPSSSGHAKPKDRLLRLTITDIANGGEGLAHADVDGTRTAILVARTVPGDIIDAAVRRSGGALRGELVAILQAAPDRVTPPCAWSQECGGCDLMHLAVPSQRKARTRIVDQALERAAGWNAPITEHTAPSTEGCRARVRLAVKTDGRGVSVGYRAPRSHDIVEVGNCLLLVPGLNDVRGEVRTWLLGSRGQGDLTVQQGPGGKPSALLTWEGQIASHAYAHAEARVASGTWSGVQIALDGSKVPAVIGDPRSMTTGLDGAPVYAPPGGFMQASDAMNVALAKRVVELAACDGRSTLELFSGSGNFTVGLARATNALAAVESDAAAVEAARGNLAARGLKAKLHCGDADQHEIHPDVRVVVIDPPRTGAPGAAPRSAASKARQVVIVSCDPATLARDVVTLVRQGFSMASVDVFEMFPHTSHVETVAVLVRSRARKG